MESSNQVLADAQIHARLATDSGIHLRLHSRGNLDQIHASHVERSQQAGHIAHYATTKSDNHSVSISPQPDQFLGEAFDRDQLFVALAVRHLQPCRFESRRGERRN
jgi:hypothetical protein